jgi:hypothetical protein
VDVSDRGVEALVVEPVDPFRGGEFHVGEAVPGLAGLDQLSFAGADLGSMSALSKALLMVPIEASMPAPRRCAVNAKDGYPCERGGSESSAPRN